jgi:hypothetical protein
MLLIAVIMKSSNICNIKPCSLSTVNELFGRNVVCLFRAEE